MDASDAKGAVDSIKDKLPNPFFGRSDPENKSPSVRLAVSGHSRTSMMHEHLNQCCFQRPCNQFHGVSVYILQLKYQIVLQDCVHTQDATASNIESIKISQSGKSNEADAAADALRKDAPASGAPSTAGVGKSLGTTDGGL